MPTKTKTKPARKPVRSKALARRHTTALVDDGTPMGIAQRLARDPKLTVEKLEKLIALNERMLAQQAAIAFHAAYESMKMELPIIDRKGRIRNKDGEVQSQYARFEDIQRITLPILQRHGFTLSYKTRWPAPTIVCVVGRLKHRGGHFEESEFQSAPDTTGGKNAIQALGSANAYGRRYTTKDLLDLQEQNTDDDGVRANPKPTPRRGRRDQGPPDIIDAERSEDPRDATHNASEEPITEGQLQRLKVLIKTSGRIDRDVKVWIGKRYSVKTLTEIRRCDYDFICAAIESPRDLPKLT